MRVRSPEEDAIMEAVKNGSLVTKILIFILAMLLGMAILVGAVAGTLYAAFAWVSLDRLQGLGVGINADGFLEPDSALRGMSILEMIAEFGKISSELSTATLSTLTDRYGVILPEAVFAVLPEEMMEIPLSNYREQGILNVYLSTATVGHALALAGQDVLPEAARVKMQDRTLDLLVDQKLDLLFEDVYVGDLMGIAVEKGSDGIVEPVLGEGEEATISSYLATLDLGEYFAAEDRNAVLQATLDRTPMEVLIEGSGGNPIYNAMADKHLGDMLKLEAGGFYFDLDSALEGMTLGDTLGYELKDGVWKDADGNPAKGLYAELVPLKINELADTDLMGIVEDMYVGELMELEQGEVTTPATDTEAAKYEWSDEDGAVTGLRLSLANLKVGVLMNEELNADTLGLNDQPLYEVLGYEKKTDGKWYDTAGNRVSGSLSALMEIKVGELSTGVDDLYVGELMGYTIKTDAAGNWLDKDDNTIPEGGDPYFEDDAGKAPTGASASIVTLKVGDLDNPSALDDKIATIKVGDAMGYCYKEHATQPDKPEEDLYYGTWYTDDTYTTEADGVMALLMNSTVENLNGDIDKLYFGEFMGYDKYDTTTGKLADKNTPKANLVFRKEDGEGGYTEPDGLIGEFADMTIKELRDETELNKKIDGTEIGTVLGYKEEGGVWKKNGNEATGVLRSLMDSTLATLDTDVNALYLGEAMGYDPYEYVENGVKKIGFRKGNNEDGYTEPSELMKTFADLTLKDMEDESIFSERIKGVRVGDAMGYYYKPDKEKVDVPENDLYYGVWYKDSGYKTKVTGVFSTLSNYKVNEMDGAVKHLTVADALGYEYNDTKKQWEKDSVAATGIFRLLMDSTLDKLTDKSGEIYLGEIMGYTNIAAEGQTPVFRRDGNGDGDYTDGEDIAPTGAIAEFAGLTVKQLEDDSTITTTIEGMEIGVAMGYTKVGDVWYSVYSDDDDSSNDKPVPEDNHLLAAIIDTKVESIGDKMHTLTLADVLAYKYTPPAGSTLKPGDAGYYDGGTWKTKDGKDIDGFMKMLHPQTPVDEIETEVHRIQAEATMGEFVSSGTLVLEDGYEDILDDKLGTTWRTLPLSEFVNALIFGLSKS